MPELKLVIQNGEKAYAPVAKDEITWETARQGSPGKLTFSVMKNGALDFQEGNQVGMSVDGKDIFYGFVFSKSRNKDGFIEVTAYDQLRYLKNKDTFSYEKKKASEVLHMLAKDFNLSCGVVEDTGYIIPSRLEDNQTLFDVLKNALDETQQALGETYILYDEYGKLTLKNLASMKLDVLMNDSTAEDFDYTSSIDSNTYNQVKLVYANQDTGLMDVYQTFDSNAINNWGLLQYFEKLNSPENARKKADSLLQFYNHKTRNLSLKKAFGDIRVRGGSLVPVKLDLGDIVTNHYMLVDKVVHKLTADTHFMDLTLIGGEFIA